MKPKSEGGGNISDNLIAVHKKCNK
ncbi:HNH endonuclease [Spiroplasma litorale]